MSVSNGPKSSLVEPDGREASRKRVAVVKNNFLPFSEAFLHEEVSHLRRYAPTVFARTQRNADRFTGHRVIAVETLPEDPHPVAAAFYNATARSKRHNAELAGGGFDLVHGYFIDNALTGMAFANRYDLPLVVSLLGHDVSIVMGREKYRPDKWHYLFGHERLFRRASMFLSISAELRDRIIECGCPAEKVHVHHVGIDLSRFHPAEQEDPGPPRVIMVGRFVEKKGFEYGLRAAAIARDAGHEFRLLLMGDGELRPEYEAIIRELGLHDVVEMPGVLKHDEIARNMRGAALAMVPSVVGRLLDREGAPTVAKEAAASGLPVLATLHGGLPELVDDGKTGFLVPERDAEALGARLTDLLASPQMRRKMAVAARKKMEREYDVGVRCAALEDFYDEAVKQYAASRKR